MSDVDDLVAFLRAQLDEDERVAREVAALAPFDEWDAVGSQTDDEIGRSNWEVVRIARPPLTPAAKAISEHIARWDPARVLAEVEAKRRVLDECERRWHAEDPNYDVRRTDGNWGDALAFAVKALAQPYAGREGWDARWALG